MDVFEEADALRKSWKETVTEAVPGSETMGIEISAMIAGLEVQVNALADLILASPSGGLRNGLCDVNIVLYRALSMLKFQLSCATRGIVL